jgi:hypothetical protein
MLFPSIETGTAMKARESENYLPISRSYDTPETNTFTAENRMRSNLELLPVINVKSRPRYISALKKSSPIYLGLKNLDTILMH